MVFPPTRISDDVELQQHVRACIAWRASSLTQPALGTVSASLVISGAQMKAYVSILM